MDTGAADSRRIVLLGKTGSGKSSLANTIFGVKDLFKVCHASTSGTTVCQFEKREVYETSVQLIDTPGLFDTDPDAPDFQKEILKCMIESSSGVHAFLLVLKVERFTKHEQSVAEVIGKHFSEGSLRYTTVVFTQGDQLEEGVTLNDWIRDNQALKTLVEKCGGRCHVFDNRYWNNSQDPYRNNQYQVRELLRTVDQTMEENGGKCYTNDNLQWMQEQLQQEKVSIKESPKNVNMSEEEVDQKARDNTSHSLGARLKLAVEDMSTPASDEGLNVVKDEDMTVVTGLAVSGLAVSGVAVSSPAVVGGLVGMLLTAGLLGAFPLDKIMKKKNT